MAATLVAYGAWESKQYRRRTYYLPVLPSGASIVRILQISDLHLAVKNKKLIRFVESLADLSYDLVLATGDLLGEPHSTEQCIRALNLQKAKAGKFFVLGSSDYYAPVFKNYLDYFLKRRRHGTIRNPTARLITGLTDGGWQDLRNRSISVKLSEVEAQLTGLDDPYLNRDDRSLLSRQPGAGLAVCVTHDPSPYKDALNAGFDLVVAGHTHGGQVRLPFVGAVVTNSTVPTSVARGPSRMDKGWLFVTPGLGTAKFAPFRFLCPPEASVLILGPPLED